MSIQTQIDRLKANVENSYVAVAAKGGTVLANQNSDNLPDAIMGIPVSSGGSNYQISITFDSAFLGHPYTVTGPEEETHTGVVPDSLQETVQVYHGGSEYTVTSTDSSGNGFSATVLVGSLFGTYSVTIAIVPIYGAIWDGTSTTKWTRTDDAAGFTDPVPYVAGATNYSSPFDDIMPWAGMTIEERTAGTMVKIPKFWYKLEQNTAGTPSSGMTIRIADKPVEGFFVSPAHMDRGDGHGERDVVYVGRYHCSASDYKSRTGEKPKVNITRATARTEIHKLGNDIWQMDFATLFTIWLLYLVEFADWNSQKCIGYGCCYTSDVVENTGYTNSMPYHTGTTKTSRTTYGLGTQYRNIEGMWDNGAWWADGCYSNTDGLNIILNPNYFNDSTNGILAGEPGSGLFPSELSVTSSGEFNIFIPTKFNGTGTTYICDRLVFSKNTPCIMAGCGAKKNDAFGLFQIYSFESSSVAGGIGCMLEELP